MAQAKTKKPKRKLNNLLLTNPPDTEDNPLTHKRLMDWLAKTGWVENHLRSRISPLDRNHIEDYIQEVWIQILEVPPEKMLEIYRRGKGKFVNYIKSIIMNNIYSKSSHLYKNVREPYHKEYYLTDEQWQELFNESRTDIDMIFPIHQPTKERESFFDKVQFEHNLEPISTEIKFIEDAKEHEEG